MDERVKGYIMNHDKRHKTTLAKTLYMLECHDYQWFDEDHNLVEKLCKEHEDMVSALKTIHGWCQGNIDSKCQSITPYCVTVRDFIDVKLIDYMEAITNG